MEEDSKEKSDASAPEGAGMRFQELGVVIYFFGRLIDLEIADQVANDKAKQDETGDRHDGFLAHSGLPETE